MLKHLILLKIQNIRLMVYKLFDKKFSGGSAKNNKSNQELAKELHKPIVWKTWKTQSILFF